LFKEELKTKKNKKRRMKVSIISFPDMFIQRKIPFLLWHLERSLKIDRN